MWPIPVTTAAMRALLIAGPIHPPKVKYLKQVTITSTITVSGPIHTPKVKYSLKQTHNNCFRTNTSSQSEIFSETSNSSYTETGTSTDIREEFSTPSQSESKVTSSASNSETSRTTTSSKSEIFMETTTEYDTSSEAS